jgi:anion-transporting  ArsA/GET3 family ATPase
MAIRQMVVNHVMEDGTCDFCSRRKNAQQKYLQQLSEMQCNITRVPMFPEEIKGLQALDVLRSILFSHETEDDSSAVIEGVGINQQI